VKGGAAYGGAVGVAGFLARARAKAQWETKRAMQWARNADGTRQLLRAAMNDDISKRLAQEAPGRTALEITGRYHEHHPWARFDAVFHPDFDICAPPEPVPQYDVVICEQVLEHVADPAAAVRNLRRMVTHDGLLVVSTPFLVRVHYDPNDYWRFTTEGLKLLLTNNGFVVEEVKSWGNRSAVSKNLGGRWLPRRPWHSMRNDHFVPAVVWAYARPGS
jgi:SAM-dependent methyltransferase